MCKLDVLPLFARRRSFFIIDIYRGLRCRPGDLAVIVQDEPECQINLGQVVRVIEEYTQFREEMGVHWLEQELDPLSFN